ncbi:MAG TPA: hypothetical protein VMI92_04340 [Steroidobacteraceae bacterium]|nr:hypothetical protein [Steroidobacteraceae bacterium]
MIRIIAGTCLIALSLGATEAMAAALTPAAPAGTPAAIPANIAAAVADASRSDADRQRDAVRKPAEVLAFAGVKLGDRVGELMPGRGYYTSIFCKAVGPSGHVYTMDITRVMDGPPGPPPGAPAGAGPGGPGVGAPGGPGGPGGPPAETTAKGAGMPCTNVTADSRKAAEFSLPAGLDMVWTSENYHDLHNRQFGAPDMTTFNKAVFNALKPGGVYMIEDHASAPGTGTSVTETLHRIDEESVKKEVTSAGFVLSGESDVLRNPADPHDVKTFDLNGKSDKFLLKFTKPKR